jgi:ELWxxDGT repeat protein
MNERATLVILAAAVLCGPPLAACAPPAAAPARPGPVAATAPAAPAPAGYGPAFRVSRALQPNFFSDRPVTADLNGKLILPAIDLSDPTRWPGLWTTDGTEAGTRLLRARLLVRPASSRGDSPFVPFAGALYFSAAEYDANLTTASGYELWRTDGTPEGTYQVTDLNPGPSHAWPRELTVARGSLYFVAGTDGEGYGSHLGLYRTDGSAAGTTLVAPVEGINSDDRWPSLALTAAGGNLFFRLQVVYRGYELHRLAPCPGAPQRECATLVKDLSPSSGSHGSIGSLPEMLVALGDQLIFAADAEAGRGLYRSDGTAAGTYLLTAAAYVGPSNGERLSIAAGGQAYLLQYGAGLWRTDGTVEGTELLTGGHGVWQYWMSSALGVVYFWGAEPIPGTSDWTNGERWRTDGTVAGTHMLADLCPGSCSSWSAGEPPMALEPEGRLFFAAQRDGANWLWTSDGTEAGTIPLQDFRGITDDRATGPQGMARAGDLVYFGIDVPGPLTASSGLYDQELWAVRVDLADRTPPGLACPPALVAEASGPAGASVDYSVTARDNLTPEVAVSLSRPPGWFPLGSTEVEASATDAAGNTGRCSFTVTVRDTTPPALACPADLVAEASSADGSAVAFAAAALDAVSSAVVTTTPSSGAVFPLGTTAVSAVAVDEAGNSASCAFTVTVRDARAPLLRCPPDQALEATAPEGSPGSWPDAVALDLVSAATVRYAPARGELLSLGSHAVVATALDAAGNLATCGFTVLVGDSRPPVLTCPADVTVVASLAGGLPVTFPAPTATDTATAAPLVELDHASGSLFPEGVTRVSATSRDLAGNVGSCTFQVEVVRASPPPAPPAAAHAGCSTGQAGAGSLLALLALLRRRPTGSRRGGGRGARGPAGS